MSDLRLVIVDDDPVARDLLSALLSDAPFACIHACEDASGALELARLGEGDVFLIDYRLGAADGLALLRALRELPETRHARLVLMTASGDHALRTAALDAGADEFLLKPFDAAEVKARVRSLLRGAPPPERLEDALLARETEVVFRLARVIERGERAANAHLLRVAGMAELIARRLGAPAAWCGALRAAAPLHDVGMQQVPEHIVTRAGRLSRDEQAVVRRHAEAGHALLAGSSSPVLALAAEIAWTHHEWWDGTGYPRGLAGTDIPLAGRIVAVADVFDALIVARPWRAALPFEDAVVHLQMGAGRQFDPACVDAFVAALPDVRQLLTRLGRVTGQAGTAAPPAAPAAPQRGMATA